VIVLAVLVPVAALAIAAAVATSSSSDDEATATTLVQDGDPAADAAAQGEDQPAGDDDGTAAPSDAEDEPTTTAAADEERSGDDVDATPAGDAPGGNPGAGGEAERPTVTYPQPTVPSGGCDRPSGTAVITLDDVPSPACLELAPDQPVVIRNRTGREISVVAIGLNEVVAAGADARVGAARDAFGDGRSTFWSPGNPALSGIVEVG
jgi:hypothetical protein